MLSIIEGGKLKTKTKTKAKANKRDKKEELIDLTGLKPQKSPKTVASSLGYGSSSNNQSDVFMRYASEYVGLERTYDEYDRYEDIFDTNAEEYLVNQDARMIRSEITITDGQGRNKRLVRRQDDNNYHK